MTKIATSKSAVEQMIETAEGRARERKITFDGITDILGEIEAYILQFSTKTDAYGTNVTVDINSQRFPRAYKYTPESTHFKAEFKKNGWKITDVYRAKCGTHLYELELTDATKAHMIDFVSTVLS